MIPPEQLSDPTVRQAISAINSGDRDAFVSLLAPNATLSDDGSERDPLPWIEHELFSSGGHIDVDSQSDDGRSLVARFRNNAWGEMRVRLRFFVTDDGQIRRFEAGQA